MDPRRGPAVRRIAWLALVLSLLLSTSFGVLERHTHGPLDASADCAACLALGTAPEAPPAPVVLSETLNDSFVKIQPIAEEIERPTPPRLVRRLRAPPPIA